VLLRRCLARIVLTLLIATTALASVGLTAPADAVFSIAVQPSLFRLDPVALDQSRAHILGLDIDIRLGSMHLHVGWPGVPL
jgi:hypothetical protein